MKLTRSFGLGVAALFAATLVAFAAGNWSNLPVIGASGTAYCALYQGNGTTCVGFVPAGPSVVTGNELVPADTQLANGIQPQTIRLPMAALNALPVTVSTVVSSAISSVTATNLTGGIILHSTGTISQVTITLPSAPIDGQQFAVNADQSVTSLTVTSPTAGVTVTKTPTGITSSTTLPYGYRFMYNAAATNWYRLQ
jgi:hypothetical protein